MPTYPPKQIPLSLALPNTKTFEYLVPHSGIAEAVASLRSLVAEGVGSFQLVVLSGPEGSGKSHLADAALTLWRAAGREGSHFDLRAGYGGDLSGTFVAEYERVKRERGLLIVECDGLPQELVANPHIQSRIAGGISLELSYPPQAEIRPLVESLLERQSLRLPVATIDFLVERLPRNPLSIEQLVSRINEAALSGRTSAHRRLVSSVLRD